jgi:CRISPR system Cascade subunit CasC
MVKERLIKDGIDTKMAEIAALKVTGFGNADGKEREKEMDTAQIMFVTEQDVEAAVKVLKEAINEAGTSEKLKEIKADVLESKMKYRRPITPDMALFGRMITSNAFDDVEASMQVAHALSVNKMDHEFDYFTAVDDMKPSSDPGAGMIGDVEFNSSCYYKYFSLDFDSLVSTLAGPKPDEKAKKEAREIAAVTLRAFLKAAIFTTPSGKQNTFAAHQLPDAILVEVRPKKTPVSYANAFVKPVKPKGEKGLVEASVEQMADHADILNKKFNLESSLRLWFTTGKTSIEGAQACKDINELVDCLTRSL